MQQEHIIAVKMLCATAPRVGITVHANLASQVMDATAQVISNCRRWDFSCHDINFVLTKSHDLQCNLDLTKYQGTVGIDSLYLQFVISSFFSIHYTISGLKISFVIPRTSLYGGSLNQGSTVLQ